MLADVLLATTVVVIAMLLATWVLSVWLRDASIVDPVWGLGFVLISATALVVVQPGELAKLILGIATLVWGTRLAGYLLWRKLQEPEEDYRYAAMRKRHGRKFWWVSLLTVFMLQGVIMLLVALPVTLGLASETPGSVRGVLLSLGLASWAIGLFFEAVGDWQLARFKANRENRGKVLDRGLWRYTRHPNYFGDAAVWWGLGLMGVAAGAPAWTLVCPAVMSLLLMKVSGVALTERTITERRPAYADYQRRTSAFFPWPPRT